MCLHMGIKLKFRKYSKGQISVCMCEGERERGRERESVSVPG